MTAIKIPFNGTSRIKISKTNVSRILTLVDVGSEIRPYLTELNNYLIGVAFQIEAARASFDLPNLAKAPYPQIAPEDTVSEKMAKIADIQSEHPWIGLELWQSRRGFNGQSRLASIPLQNKGQITYADLKTPFLTTGDVKLLDKNDRLLVKVDLNGQTFGDDD